MTGDIDSYDSMLAQTGDEAGVLFASSLFLQMKYSPIIIFSACFVGIFWAVYNVAKINRIDMTADVIKYKGMTKETKEDLEKEGKPIPYQTPEECLEAMKRVAGLIESGAIEFIRKEYTFLTIFCGAFGTLIYFTVDFPIRLAPYTTLAFVIGAATSMLCGYIGMRVAVFSNVKTTWACNISIDDGFHVAFNGGQVLGFALVGLGLLVLQCIVMLYDYLLMKDQTFEDLGDSQKKVRHIFEMVAGYGLGGSTVALFGRVGGGIYTKAADVGADLAGKVCQGLEEDSPDNPGTIADNVGDNVGDIAGMGADLFGSLAEATCAALVVSSHGPQLIDTVDAVFFPQMVTAVGIFASLVSVFFAIMGTVTEKNVESKLKLQLLISTIVMSLLLLPVVKLLPETADLEFAGKTYHITRWYCYASVAAGLWSGLIIGFVTEYFTSNQYAPVRGLAEACRMGAAPNIILGLALGYASTIIPIICLAVTIWVSFTFAGLYGVALAAIGMLGCLPIALTIDGYGPIADNAGGISEMSQLEDQVRKNTDTLDAAGNTTAAIGKGFAIGSACLVALALFGAYITRIEEHQKTGETSFVVNILEPTTFAGLIIGAMIPYAFSALTMSAVGDAANEMIAEIKSQFEAM